jgi:PleD family two-component response regulator
VNKTNNDAKKQAKILIVDDQEEIFFGKMILKKHLGNFQQQMKKIITILGENQIDVVILDELPYWF